KPAVRSSEVRCHEVVIIQVSPVEIAHRPNPIRIHQRGRLLARVIGTCDYESIVERRAVPQGIVQVPITMSFAPIGAWILRANRREVKRSDEICRVSMTHV